LKTLALIPARAGSKRVPGKNIRPLCGKPLIQYSIEHAKATAGVDRIAVTTDDPKAAEIARSLGCDVIDRPPHLASDKASTTDAVKHALEVYRAKNEFPQFVLLLQPTVPIRELATLVESLRILENTGCDSVTSHVLVDFQHPNRLKVIRDGRLSPYADSELEKVPRNELPPVYCRDGSIYAFRAALPFEQDSLMGRDQRAVVSNDDYFVNIDNNKDWLLAEALVSNYHHSIV
jgi:CMP-N,N'-diacetyllegionaminic acid synthase